jgi:hypothetical protein
MPDMNTLTPTRAGRTVGTLLLPLVAGFVVACNGDSTSPGPSNNSPNLNTMEVGEVRSFSLAQLASDITVSDEMNLALIVANTNVQNEAEVPYRLVIGSPGGAASINFAPTQALQRRSRPFAATEFVVSNKLEAKIRAYERSRFKLSRSRSKIPFSISTAKPILRRAEVPAVGETVVRRLPDINAPSDSLCDAYFNINAVVRAVGERAIILTDVNTPANGLTNADFTALAAEFDDKIFVTDSAYFGNPTDIDDNGHIEILFSPKVNQFTDPESEGFIGGFFFTGDLFPRNASGGLPGCEQSNEAEIFYILAADPSGTYGNAFSASFIRQLTRGTVAHEFQHMINSGTRLYVNLNAQTFEASWLDEGLSHLAEELVGRSVLGYSDLQTLRRQEVAPASEAPNYPTFSAFFFQNLGRLQYWLERPDTSAAITEAVATELAHRGAAWALLRYTADHYSNNNVKDFTQRLVLSNDSGTVNFREEANADIEDILHGWLTTIYTDHFGIPGLDDHYQYRSWDLRDVEEAINENQYPLRVQSITVNTTNTGTVPTSSANYYRLNIAGGNGTIPIRLQNGNGTPVNFAGAHLYVVRIQ